MTPLIDRDTQTQASEAELAAQVRRQCGLEVEARRTERNQSNIELRLVQGGLPQPAQVNRLFMRWLIQNLRCPATIIFHGGKNGQRLLAFGYPAGTASLYVGGKRYDPPMHRLSLPIALSQVGNSFLFEGEDSILYPGIVLATENIIRPS